MKLQTVIRYALDDKAFSEEFEKKARAAALAGINSPEWEDYMKYFAENDTELARLTPRVKVKGVNFDTRATMYLLGTHTFTSLYMTFTETLSLACTPYRSPKSRAKKTPSQSKAAKSGAKAKRS